MAEHNELGELGENIATKYLISLGYEIVERQWRYQHKEIDIIARKNLDIHIIEVKTRRTDFGQNISDLITHNKEIFLIEAASAYLEMFDLSNNLQFDLIAIFFEKEKYKIQFIQNAFIPE